jgi:hypothetical protein
LHREHLLKQAAPESDLEPAIRGLESELGALVVGIGRALPSPSVSETVELERRIESFDYEAALQTLTKARAS